MLALSTHHRLEVALTSEHEFRVDLRFPVGDHPVDAGPSVSLQLAGEFRDEPMTLDEWVAAQQAKHPQCQCGCGGEIQVRPQHHGRRGLPSYVPGHHKAALSVAIQALNDQGYLTISQVAKRMGVGESTVRRAEARGTLIPEWRTIGARAPMRVYHVDGESHLVVAAERTQLDATESERRPLYLARALPHTPCQPAYLPAPFDVQTAPARALTVHRPAKVRSAQASLLE